MIWGETHYFRKHPHPFYICNAQGLQHWVCDLKVEELSEVANRCADTRRMASDTLLSSQLRSLRCAFLRLLLSWTRRNEKISIKKTWKYIFVFWKARIAAPKMWGLSITIFEPSKNCAGLTNFIRPQGTSFWSQEPQEPLSNWKAPRCGRKIIDKVYRTCSGPLGHSLSENRSINSHFIALFSRSFKHLNAPVGKGNSEWPTS